VNPKMPRKLLVEAVVSALSVSPKALRRRSLRAIVGGDRTEFDSAMVRLSLPATVV